MAKINEIDNCKYLILIFLVQKDRADSFPHTRRENYPGPGAYEQNSKFDVMVENERIRKKKKGTKSVNPSLSHIVSCNSTSIRENVVQPDTQLTESTTGDLNTAKGNFDLFESSVTTASRVFKMQNSKSSFPSPRRCGNKFGKSERKYNLTSNTNSKVGPGSYMFDDGSKTVKNYGFNDQLISKRETSNLNF